MGEPLWETALVKYQFALFTLIMGQSHCGWRCNESNNACKNHKKGGFFWHSWESGWSRAILLVCQWKANIQRSDFTDNRVHGSAHPPVGCVECTTVSEEQQSLCHANCWNHHVVRNGCCCFVAVGLEMALFQNIRWLWQICLGQTNPDESLLATNCHPWLHLKMILSGFWRNSSLLPNSILAVLEIMYWHIYLYLGTGGYGMW